MQMKWVKLKKYIELTGETSDSVHAKRRTGQFIDGVHTKIAEDGKVWVNLEKVTEWVEQGKRSASQGA